MKNKMIDDKDQQQQYNEGIQDKFEIVFNKMELIQDDKVSNDKLETELERYTTLRRFIRVEDQMETFMTRKLNDSQNINMEDKIGKIWSTLDRDYFVKDDVTDKFELLT